MILKSHPWWRLLSFAPGHLPLTIAGRYETWRKQMANDQ